MFKLRKQKSKQSLTIIYDFDVVRLMYVFLPTILD